MPTPLKEAPDNAQRSFEAARPVLLLLKGPPGSGKSTLAQALASALRWPLVDKDDARSSFQPLVAANPAIDWNELSYAVMWRVAEAQLRCRLSLIVDCPLARRSLFDTAAALAEKHGARLALVELEPRDAGVWRQRVEQRGAADRCTEHEHKPGSWADIQAVAARNSGSEAWSQALQEGRVGPLRCLLDSTADGAAEQLSAVLGMLREGGVDAPEPRHGSHMNSGNTEDSVAVGAARSRADSLREPAM